MKRIALLALLCAMNTSYAAKLANFQEAYQALSNGKLLTFVVHFDKCQLKGDSRLVPEMAYLGVFKPTGIMAHTNTHIRARGLTFTPSIDLFPQLGPVNQAYSYTMDANNQLTVINSFLDPVTFVDKMNPIELTCEIGKGFDVFA